MDVAKQFIKLSGDYEIKEYEAEVRGLSGIKNVSELMSIISLGKYSYIIGFGETSFQRENCRLERNKTSEKNNIVDKRYNKSIIHNSGKHLFSPCFLLRDILAESAEIRNYRWEFVHIKRKICSMKQDSQRFMDIASELKNILGRCMNQNK
jgi:hypothetical protein